VAGPGGGLFGTGFTFGEGPPPLVGALSSGFCGFCFSDAFGSPIPPFGAAKVPGPEVGPRSPGMAFPATAGAG